jgi:hypothetical protein
MIWVGIAFLIVGLLWTAFKGYVVWDVAHDLFNGGGVPTLDFAVFCPMPLAFGASLVLTELGASPFPGFGFVIYLGLAVGFGALMWLFYRLGEPDRQRASDIIMQQFPPSGADGHER